MPGLHLLPPPASKDGVLTAWLEPAPLSQMPSPVQSQAGPGPPVPCKCHGATAPRPHFPTDRARLPSGCTRSQQRLGSRAVITGRAQQTEVLVAAFPTCSLHFQPPSNPPTSLHLWEPTSPTCPVQGPLLHYSPSRKAVLQT